MKKLTYIVMAMATTCILTACSDDNNLADMEEVQPERGAVKTQLTIAIPTMGSDKAATRQSDEVVQKVNGSFRGLQDIFLFTTRTTATTVADMTHENTSLTSRVYLPAISGNAVNHIGPNDLDKYPEATLQGHVYAQVEIPIGTNAFLFYGKAIDHSESDNHSLWSTNGHMWKNIASDNPEDQNLSPTEEGIPENNSWYEGDLTKLRFRPYSIFLHETNAELKNGYKVGHALAAYLSDVANAILGYRYGVGETGIDPETFELTGSDVQVYRYNMNNSNIDLAAEDETALQYVKHTELDDVFTALTGVSPGNPTETIYHWVGGQRIARAGQITGSSTNVFESVQDLYTVIRFYDNDAAKEVLKVIAKGLDEQYVDANGLPKPNELTGRLMFTEADGAEAGHTAVYRGDRIFVNYNNISWGADLAGALSETPMINYPNDIELPDGVARMMYNKTNHRFEMKMTSVDNLTNAKEDFYRAFGVTDVYAFAYPLPLYYRGVSMIKTSEEKEEEHYVDGEAEWSEILSQYDDGTEVVNSTKSVVMTDPVQYGVARLDINVRTSGENLLDGEKNANHKVLIGSNNFPITSVLISGQRAVGWDFNPIKEGEDLTEYVVYDRHVNSDIYLTHLTGDEYVPVTSTLVLPSSAYSSSVEEAQQQVRVAIECENKSGVVFTGVNGQLIAQNCKFYLIGQLPLSELTEGKRFFQQDHVTTLNLTVNSLENAYNTIPNLRAPLLELGIVIDNWILATPTNVKL